ARASGPCRFRPRTSRQSRPCRGRGRGSTTAVGATANRRRSRRKSLTPSHLRGTDCPWRLAPVSTTARRGRLFHQTPPFTSLSFCANRQKLAHPPRGIE